MQEPTRIQILVNRKVDQLCPDRDRSQHGLFLVRSESISPRGPFRRGLNLCAECQILDAGSGDPCPVCMPCIS